MSVPWEHETHGALCPYHRNQSPFRWFEDIGASSAVHFHSPIRSSPCLVQLDDWLLLGLLPPALDSGGWGQTWTLVWMFPSLISCDFVSHSRSLLTEELRPAGTATFDGGDRG